MSLTDVIYLTAQHIAVQVRFNTELIESALGGRLDAEY